MTTAILYNGLLAPVTATATNSNASYPITNILTSAVLREWQSSSLAANTVVIDLGASLTFRCVAFSVINVLGVTVSADNANPPTTVRGTLTISQDSQGRYKGSLDTGASITARYISLAFPLNASRQDGAAFYRIGAAYVFQNAYSFARDPLYGNSNITVTTPQSRIDLDNGAVICDSTGPSFQKISMDFSGGVGDDHEQLQQYARAGICWLDLNNPSALSQQWPVRHRDQEIVRKLSGFNREQVTIMLKEQVE